MFVEQVWKRAQAVKFIHGRLSFHNVDGSLGKTNSGAPSVLVAYGNLAVKKLKNSKISGTFLTL